MANVTEVRPFWNKVTYCVITGASRGIGRQIAIDFAKNVNNGSVFLLLARNIDNLNETKRLMEEANSNINVLTHSINLNEPIGVELHKMMAMALVTAGQENSGFELALIVHNAGSLGDVTESVREMRNLEKIESYFMFNLHSVMILNVEFIKTFDEVPSSTELAFINITSLCAIKPFPSMGYYCMGKSVREMYFQCLYEENKNFTVLSYSPGPVLTDMADEIVNNVQNDGVKKMFLELREKKKMLTAEQTVDRLVNLLKTRAFQNGSRKDYYDE